MGEKAGTRVFKKSSPNCKLTVYLGKRDFVDHLDRVDPVDGVVLVDPDYLKDRKGPGRPGPVVPQGPVRRHPPGRAPPA